MPGAVAGGHDEELALRKRRAHLGVSLVEFDLRLIRLAGLDLGWLIGNRRLMVRRNHGRLDQGFRSGNRDRLILRVEGGGNGGLASCGTSVGWGLLGLL